MPTKLDAMCCWVFAILLVAIVPAPVFAGAQGDRVKLPMFDVATDYREAIRNGTIAPDRVLLPEGDIFTGMSETALVRRLGNSPTESEPVEFRGHLAQEDYLRKMARRLPDSMHYYVLGDIYYHSGDLSGWYKTYDWPVTGLGTLRAFLRKRAADHYWTVWLLHFLFEPVSDDEVTFLESERPMLRRGGNPSATWDVGRNTLTIAPSADSSGNRE